MDVIKQKPRVAFQGERGAFSEEAAIKLLGDDIELVPQQTFAALFESLQPGAADYLVRRDDVNALEARQSRQQIPMRRQQPVSIGGVVAHGYHDVPPRPRARLGEELGPKQMFVGAACRFNEALKVPERADEEPRLPDKPPRRGNRRHISPCRLR